MNDAEVARLRRRSIADRLEGLVDDLDRFITEAFDAGEVEEATRLHDVRGHLWGALALSEREAPRAG